MLIVSSSPNASQAMAEQAENELSEPQSQSDTNAISFCLRRRRPTSAAEFTSLNLQRNTGELWHRATQGLMPRLLVCLLLAHPVLAAPVFNGLAGTLTRVTSDSQTVTARPITILAGDTVVVVIASAAANARTGFGVHDDASQSNEYTSVLDTCSDSNNCSGTPRLTILAAPNAIGFTGTVRVNHVPLNALAGLVLDFKGVLAWDRFDTFMQCGISPYHTIACGSTAPAHTAGALVAGSAANDRLVCAVAAKLDPAQCNFISSADTAAGCTGVTLGTTTWTVKAFYRVEATPTNAECQINLPAVPWAIGGVRFRAQ